MDHEEVSLQFAYALCFNRGVQTALGGGYHQIMSLCQCSSQTDKY